MSTYNELWVFHKANHTKTNENQQFHILFLYYHMIDLHIHALGTGRVFLLYISFYDGGHAACDLM